MSAIVSLPELRLDTPLEVPDDRHRRGGLSRLDVGDRFLTLQQLVDDATAPSQETLAAYARGGAR